VALFRDLIQRLGYNEPTRAAPDHILVLGYGSTYGTYAASVHPKVRQQTSFVIPRLVGAGMSANFHNARGCKQHIGLKRLPSVPHAATHTADDETMNGSDAEEPA
jgi:hypothetical protein